MFRFNNFKIKKKKKQLQEKNIFINFSQIGIFLAINCLFKQFKIDPINKKPDKIRDRLSKYTTHLFKLSKLSINLIDTNFL